MRVVQVIYSFEIGGSETVGRNLALGMSRKGQKAAVCALEGDGVLNRELRDEGIETSVIARKSREYGGPILRINSFFRRFKPDLVHTHHLHELVFSALPARAAGIPLIHTEHETNSLKSAKAKRRLRRLASLCRFVTGVSHEVSQFLSQEVGIPREKVRTIPNGIDLKTFQPSEEGLSQRPTGKPLALGSVARLNPLKDQVTLLRAFAILRGVFSDSTLVLVGEGELRSELEATCGELGIRDNVRFLGARRDVASLLKEMDIFVLSSIAEGLPVAIMEAMAAGPVVVATRVGSVPELIRPNETGFLVEPGDPEALASCLRKVADRLPELEPVTAAARNLIRESYNFEDTLAAYMRLYDEAAPGCR